MINILAPIRFGFKLKPMRQMIPILFALLLPLSLTGCYQPVYGQKSLAAMDAPTAQEEKLGAIQIGSIPDVTGQRLRNMLIDRFYSYGRPTQPLYRLDVRLTPLEEKLGLQKDATVTRARLTLTANYDLVDSATSKIIFSGFSRSVVSNNVLNDEYATLTSREDAYDRAVRELSDLITTRLLIHFNQNDQK
jgi:LPS-assembly lipoprotein